MIFASVCKDRCLKAVKKRQLDSERPRRQSNTLPFAACDSATLKSSCADWGMNSRVRRGQQQQLASCMCGKVSRHLQLLKLASVCVCVCVWEKGKSIRVAQNRKGPTMHTIARQQKNGASTSQTVLTAKKC